jgi:hypothetical protein
MEKKMCFLCHFCLSSRVSLPTCPGLTSKDVGDNLCIFDANDTGRCCFYYAILARLFYQA